MFDRFLQLLCVFAIVAIVTSAHAQGNGKGNGKKGKHGESRQTRSKNGEYRAFSVGTHKGEGKAIIGDEGVSMTIDVTTADGTKGQILATKLLLEGPYFSGTGTAMGKTIAITGRLDAAKASRLSANYSGTSGEFGRIIGTLPEDDGDSDWDVPDDKRDKDKDKDKDKDDDKDKDKDKGKP